MRKIALIQCLRTGSVASNASASHRKARRRLSLTGRRRGKTHFHMAQVSTDSR